jgi:phenylalanyl-tRNA synthetase beta chain
VRIPLSWLLEHVNVDLDVDELAEVLTLGGLEVDAVHRPDEGMRGVVVAEVLDVHKVEGSDKLHLVTVNDGEGERRIVCGASNFAVGDRVPAALPGAVLPGGFEIGRRKLFGQTSDGMLASARELGVGDDHKGIWVLDADAPVGADVASHIGLDDPVLELEVTPDRGYGLSVLGVARDVAALTGASLREPTAVAASGDPGVPVSIEDTDRCRRFDGRAIQGVRIGPSPAWLQRRLAAAGMRPVSNIVDITNYVMLEIGNPIHAYDRSLLTGPEIVVRTARPGERLTTLDGVTRRLDPDDLAICDGAGPVGLAGVMGGESTEINDATTDVFVEVANFTARTVRRSARRHGLRTEGSLRWERQVPPEHAPLAATRCAELIVAHAGGTVTGGSDTYPNRPERPVIALRTESARAHLGADIDDDTQAELLRRVGCDVTGDRGTLEVIPPTWRPDLAIPVDLHEEIVRLYGYDRLPATLPSSGEAGRFEPSYTGRRVVRRALAGGGWTEALTFPFVAADDVERLGVPVDDRRRTTVPLVNPLSQEESVLRTTLLPGFLRAVRRGVGRQVTDLALFEVGHVFLTPTEQEPGYGGGPDDVALPAEPTMLGLVACGRFAADRFDAAGRDVDVFDLLGALDLARTVLGLPALQAVATDEAPYHPGRAATVGLGGRVLGSVGELHPRICDAWELPRRTLAGEIRLDPLVAQGVAPAIGFAPSPLPGLRFDVAVEVAEHVAASAVTALMLFDEYRGAPLEAGRKSLAWRVALDDAERQLTDTDEAAAIDAIDDAVREHVDGALRR